MRPYILHNILLELSQFILGDHVRLGDHRDNIHVPVQLFHNHQVQGLQRVTGRTNKIQTAVDARVSQDAEVALDFQLLLQIGLELRVQVGAHNFVALLLVQLVAEAHRLHN